MVLWEVREIMPRQSVFDMKASKVYPLLIAKAERKGPWALLELCEKLLK